MRVAVCLQTCERFDYTARTVQSFAQQNDPSQFLLLHSDDASTDPRVIDEAQRAGFATVVQNEIRQGAVSTRRALLEAAAARGADWVVLLENDWEWLRSFPWPLFRYVTDHPKIYALRLYGRFKDRAGKKKAGCGRSDPQWTSIPGFNAEIGSIHWGGPPTATRIAEARWIHQGVKCDADCGKRSRSLRLSTARVLENVVVHIGDTKTPGFRA